MAQTDHTVTSGLPDPGPKTYWIASMYSNDADTTGNLIIKADPAAGNLFLEQLTVLADADCASWTLNDDTTAIIGPVELITTELSHYTTLKFIRPIKISGALRIDASTNGVLNVIAEGYTA